MTNDYKSTEQRIWEWTKPVRTGVADVVEYSVKVGYGTVASLFRLPTAVRKIKERQDFLTRNPTHSLNCCQETGAMLGIIGGGVSDLAFLWYALVEEIDRGDYVPLGVWAATNLASCIFEAGRACGKRKRLENVVQETPAVGTGRES